jgi:glutamine amidotransferase/cyclase
VLEAASERVFVPLTVGGGIREFTDANGKHYSSLEVASAYFRRVPGARASGRVLARVGGCSRGGGGAAAMSLYHTSQPPYPLPFALRRSGADKISIGSDSVDSAEAWIAGGRKLTGATSIEQISRVYGKQAVVVSVDPRRVYVADPASTTHVTVKTAKPGPAGEQYVWWQCTVKGGREGRDLDAVQLAQAVEALGAGEILLNCIDNDGVKQGFDLELVEAVASAVTIPVIASSGAGAPSHFTDVFQKTGAAAALAAGIFHRREVGIQEVKQHMAGAQIPTRL